MIEKSIDNVIVALCGDYARRAEAIRTHSVSHRTEMEFRYYNFKIYDAALQIVGERLAEKYIEEIGARVGYAFSGMGEEVCERTYKTKKQSVKACIARSLHLMD